MKLSILPETYSVSRLSPNQAFPTWIDQSHFWTVTRTERELSVICLQKNVPAEVKSEGGWKILEVEGPLDFGLTGILASIAAPLATAKISIFAVSTYDTDYVLVKERDLEQAKETLAQAGFAF